MVSVTATLLLWPGRGPSFGPIAKEPSLKLARPTRENPGGENGKADRSRAAKSSMTKVGYPPSSDALKVRYCAMSLAHQKIRVISRFGVGDHRAKS